MNNPETVVRLGTQDTGGRQKNTNRIMNNPETVVRLGTQYTGGRQTKHKPNHEQSRNSGKIGHTRYRRKTNKTQTES